MDGKGCPVRFQPSLHLVDVTERGALVGWGGFWLEDAPGGVRVVDDDDLPAGGTIGACSPSYGEAVVEVLDDAGDVVAREVATDANHAWVEGLEPDTSYTYRVTVDADG